MGAGSYRSTFPRIERLYLVTRLFVLSAILTWVLIDPPERYNLIAVSVLTLVFVIQTGHFYYLSIRLGRSYEKLFIGALIFDIIFTTAVIHFTGGVHSSFYVFYYQAIAFGAYYLGLQKGLILSLGVTTLYSIIISESSPQMPMVSFLVRLYFAWGLAMAVGFVSNHSREAEQKLLKLLDTLNVRTTELEQTQVQIENIHDTSRTLGEILNLEQLLAEILRIGDSLWGYALFEIVLIDRETGALQIVASSRYGKSLQHDPPIPGKQDGVVGRVARSGAAERIVDVSSCPYYIPGLENARSELAVPMITHGRVIGVINAESKSLGNFSERDQKLVSILAGAAAMAVENARLHKQVSDLAVIDDLTGVFNYRYFSDRLAEEKRRSERYDLPLSLIMVDIDWFKRTNDTYGHEVGNVVLRELVGVIEECIRDTDRLCRYGGEEFIVILPQTNSMDAKIIGERIREKVDIHTFGGYAGIPKLRVTVSIGVTAYPDNGLTTADLISAVDSALYRAKGSGKNQVCTV